MNEKRNHSRYDTALPVTFRLAGINGTALPTTGLIGNVSLGGLFFKAQITQDQIKEIIRSKQAGPMDVDLSVKLIGRSTELRGRIAWFDIAFRGDLIQFRAGVELTEAPPRWVEFIEQVPTSLEDQQSEAW